MRKDSVNVFSEGLVYDLNPLTTPNNVLTDCVNGTFITFNGDELALQNEAGNTQVQYEEVNLIKDTNWTLNESTTVQVNFQWRVLEAIHNQFTNLVTYSENKFQFLYLSVPQNSILTIFNELDYKLYDSTEDDQLPEQEFYLLGTRVTPSGETHNVYRKKDTFNTNNRVLFRVKLFYQDAEDLVTITGNVKLPEGFLPIGIKEHGGVLYIVSAKKTDVSRVARWEPGYIAYLNEFVYYNILDKTFYRSKSDRNNSLLPLETNDKWEIIGSEEDYINYTGFVQIGTYPSPEFSGLTELKGKEIVYVENDTSEQSQIQPELYRFKTINDAIFKSGRYVVFPDSSNPLNVANLSRYNLGAVPQDKKFYKLKLYNQLNNGYLDLTLDIWDKYLAHEPTNTEKYWFRDNTFRYYCPNQYKGKLALRLEIEDLDLFRIKGMTSVQFVPEVDPNPGYYILKINVETKTSASISAQQYKIKTRLEGEIEWSPEQIINLNVDDGDNVFSGIYSENINIDNSNKIIEYEIKPIFYFENTEIEEHLIPNEYVEKYTIRGKRIISTDIEFIFSEETYECDNISFKKLVKKVSIKNLNDEYIDHYFNSSENKYIYILNTETADPDEVVIATYTSDVNGYPIITPVISEGYVSDINNMFSSFPINRFNTSCQTTTITFNFNIPFDTCSLTVMSVKQGSVNQLISPTFLQTQGKPMNGFTIEVQPGFLTEIIISRPGFELINDSFIISGSVIKNYAFIANVVPGYNVVSNSRAPYEHYLSWDGSLVGNLPTINGLTYRYYKKNEVPNTSDLVLTKELKTFQLDISQPPVYYCAYDSTKKLVYNNNFTNEDWFTLFTSGQQTLQTTYSNISNIADFRVVNGRLYDCGIPCNQQPESDYITVPVIFRNKINPALMLGQIPGGFFINISVYYVSVNQGSFGNGLGGTLIIGNRHYDVPFNFPQAWRITSDPLIAGTYNINAELLTWVSNGMAQMSYKHCWINSEPLISGGLFDVVITDSNVDISIYVSSNAELIQV